MTREQVRYCGACFLAVALIVAAGPAHAQIDLSPQSGDTPLALDENTDLDLSQAAKDAEVSRLQRSLTIEVPYRFQYLPPIVQQARITCRIPTTLVLGQGDNLSATVGYHQSLTITNGTAEGTAQVGGEYPPSDILQQLETSILRAITNITASSWQCYLDVNGPAFSQWTPAEQLCRSSQYCDNISYGLINQGQF